MKLKLYTQQNNYIFTIDDFSSRYHYFLCNNIKSNYKYAWQAYNDAKKLINNKPMHIKALKNKKYAKDEFEKPIIIDISAEHMLYDHYETLYKMMKATVKGLDKDKVRNLMIKTELEEIITELENIINFFKKTNTEKANYKFQKILNRFKKLTRAQQFKKITEANLSNKIKKAIINEYGIKICKKLEKQYKGCIFKEYNNYILIFDIDINKPLLKIKINDNLHITDIIPLGDLLKIYNIYSVEFYQKFWKNIIEMIGHYYDKNTNILIVLNKTKLPDAPRVYPISYSLNGWDSKNKQEVTIDLTFTKDLNPSWQFENKKNKISKLAQKNNELTEEDFINNQPSRVRCTDPKLHSIYGKIGEVIQVIPTDTHLEIDIDFGRKIVRLTNKQVVLI